MRRNCDFFAIAAFFVAKRAEIHTILTFLRIVKCGIFMKKISITALLPMKAHSERVPNKNIRNFSGRPLYHHILETLSKSSYIKEIRINTDSDVISTDAPKLFKKVKIINRPNELCGDFVSMNTIIAYDVSKSDDEYFLQTHSTNPLLTTKTIDEAIEKFFSSSDIHDSLFSVTRLQSRIYDEHGGALNHNPQELIRTQDLSPLYEENSNIFIFSKESFYNNDKKRIGITPFLFEVDKRESIDIDTEDEFIIAESLKHISFSPKNPLCTSQYPIVSIIIRTFNEGHHIGGVLECVFSQNTNRHFEVIIVDSGSTDKTLGIVQEYPVKIVHIKPEDFSFGYSLNKGIEVAGGEYVVLLSAHCYPMNDSWLDEIIEPFEDARIAAVYGKQRGNHVTKFSEHQLLKKMFPESSCMQTDIPFCNNANTAIRRSLWEELPYDEELTGLEDLAWAEKMQKRGHTIYYTISAGIFHIHEESWERVFIRYKREAIALKRIFPETNFSFLDFLLLFTFNTALDYCRALVFERKLKHIWEIPSFRYMQYWGTYKGYTFKNSLTNEVKKYFYHYRPFIKT